jgi:lipoate-protein ligase B
VIVRGLDLGRRGFSEVEVLQASLRERVLAGEDAETLLIVEHEPVVTLGTRGGDDDLRVSPALLESSGIALCHADRGGEATYHGPGQLVAYPVVRLRRGVVAHVEALARAVVETAERYGVAASFDRKHPGVWVEDRKLASIGVHVHRRVATHGVALNVGEEALRGFSHIVPCGMPGVRMTSLETEAAVGALDRDDVRRTFTAALLRAFAS